MKKTKFKARLLNLTRLVWSMALGATIFVILGRGIPLFYYRHIDQTVYYNILSPIEIKEDRNYKPCEVITFNVNRKSLMTEEYRAVAQLELIEGATNRVVGSAFLEGLTENTGGEYKVKEVSQALPCNIPDGEFFWKGVVDYNVRGIDRQEYFSTEHFFVKK